MSATSAPPPSLRGFAAVTGAYWAFMLTDGALRMLVLLHFHRLGFSPLQLAWLFVAYEVAGIVTNVTAGWLAARFGLMTTLVAGLTLQIGALLALTLLDPAWAVATSVVFVMLVQGASGVAKDLTKTASKSAVKVLVPGGGRLFTWVAALTGSKNAIKGVGFFLGAALLGGLGFGPALFGLAAILVAVLGAILIWMPNGLSVRDKGAKFAQIFSRDARVNWLSAARLFLFGARDVWFVVALPIWLQMTLSAGMAPESAFFLTGGFMALWIVFYGGVQALAPRFVKGGQRGAQHWVLLLVGVLSVLAVLAATSAPTAAILLGLMAFGAVFAVNSALHSYLILDFAGSDRLTRDVGFYYMANASGRLLGTVLSGLMYQIGGLALALTAALIMVLISAAALRKIPAGD